MSLWIFAYGSLLWRPDFPSAPPRPAFITGWRRRLAQGSPDHRGTPDRLGRVATLLPAPGVRCDGAVYEVQDAHREEVLAVLDHRERGGYVRTYVTATLTAEAKAVDAVTWVADQGNPYFLGEADLEAVIQQVRDARGPSGPNDEYVLRLAEALRAMGVEDDEIHAIEARLLGR